MKLVEDDAENGVSAQQIVKIGQMVEKSIDNDTNNVFDDNSGSNYSKTEYIDTNKNIDEYHVSKLPVASITSLYTTQNDQQTTPDYTNNTTEWSSLTEGTDFVVDLDSGRIHIANSSYQPITRRWGLYIDYKYGRTTPADIKLLTIIETGLKMLGATFIKDRIKKVSGVDIPDLMVFAQWRKDIISSYKHDGLTNMNT